MKRLLHVLPGILAISGLTAGGAFASVYLHPGDNIQSAINYHPSGTVFYLAAGTYRGQNLNPKSGDQFIGVAGQTILNGSVLLNSGWHTSGSLWVTHTGVPYAAQAHWMPTLSGHSMAVYPNDLFVNGQLYKRVGSLSSVTSGSWYFDMSSRAVYIKDYPWGKTIEISSTPHAFTGHGNPAWGGAYVTLQNLTVEKYASAGGDSTIRGGYGWKLNNVTAEWNHGAGAAIGAYAQIQGGAYDHNGQQGIFAYNAPHCIVNRAEIAYNNYAGFNFSYEGGGLKAGTSSGQPYSTGMQFTSNYVHDNNGIGIHVDTNNTYFTIAYNTVNNNAYAGIQDERNKGSSIHDNSLSNNGIGGTSYSLWGQINVNDSAYSQIYNNKLYVPASYGNGIVMQSISRGWSSLLGMNWKLSHISVHNNTINYAGSRGSSGMVFYDHADDHTNMWDYDTYNVPSTYQGHWYFGSSGQQLSWSSVRSSTPYEHHGYAY